jgi:hypothetical protein
LTGTDLDTMGMDVSAGSQKRLVDLAKEHGSSSVARDLDRTARTLPVSLRTNR